MTYGAYPAGRAVAERVREHFANHVEAAELVPEIAHIEALIEVGFWTSLRREESYVPTISLALVSPAAAPHPMLFAHRLPLSPAALAKVAPAVERPGIHLGVSPEDGVLSVWGATRTLPPFCLVLEVAAPGLIVVKQHRGGEHLKFANIAVLEADQVKIVDETASSLPDCPSLLTSLLGFDTPGSWSDSVNALVQLAVSMRAHKRGGLLLVVPAGSDRWRESIISPIPYALDPPFSPLAQLLQKGDDKRNRLWGDALEPALHAIAPLTPVDGATVITDRYDLLAFGAKITRRRGSPPVEQTTVTEPIEGGTADIVHPSSLGGPRHRSAPQFAHDQPCAVALVASQRRPFSVCRWAACRSEGR